VSKNLVILGLVSLATTFSGPPAGAQVRSGASYSPSVAASSGIGGMSATAASQASSIMGGPPGASVGRIQHLIIQR
jgi:hypothetical protein